MVVPPGNRRVLVPVPERYVAGADTRGRQEGRPYPWSQQVIHELPGLDIEVFFLHQTIEVGELHGEGCSPLAGGAQGG